ncbi:MAG: response regulator, partial [Thermodesulfobacteriota bacterium]|nr:response regulator [Thermodesulfobacteriota bacterium]
MKNKILIVDDEKYLLQLYIEAFTEWGYTVRSAKSAEKALEILKHENLQVMFLDLKLPGMSGVDLCRQIRKDIPMAVIYAVTGYSSLFGPSDCREAG